MESCYFGAQTFRTKIQFSFHELPPESHNSLRDSMFDLVKQINEHTNPVIATQVVITKHSFCFNVTNPFLIFSSSCVSP